MEEKEGREERRVGLRIGKVLKKLLLIVYMTIDTYVLLFFFYSSCSVFSTTNANSSAAGGDSSERQSIWLRLDVHFSWRGIGNAVLSTGIRSRART